MKVIKWKNVKERLGFRGIGCCGPTLSHQESTVDSDDELEEMSDPTAGSFTSPLLVGPEGQMNLAMALAAERNQVWSTAEEQVTAKPLLRLIEETDGRDWKIGLNNDTDGADVMTCDWMCCVCIDRSKGAAFIPCGHAFCRVCSREIWTSRGSCPVCNSPISQILDIF